LCIYAEAKDLDKLGHAMASLKKSMKWDEEVYGREYDLDLLILWRLTISIWGRWKTSP